MSVSSLGGIFCVSQIICEVFGLGLKKEGLACLGGAPDLSNLGAALADDAPDDLVGDGHLVGLMCVRTTTTASTC